MFDKKAQKVLHFFAAGFGGLENALSHWAVIGKANQRKQFPTIFCPYKGGDEHLKEVNQYVEDAIVENVNILTQGQRTADWFTLRAFHLSATVAGLVFNSNYDNKPDEDIIKQLCKSWFSHTRSTTGYWCEK
jgi:hypothetical protein